MFKCPECGSTDRFTVAAVETSDVNCYVDGDGDAFDCKTFGSSTEWSSESAIDCWECNHSGVVADFLEPSNAECV